MTHINIHNTHGLKFGILTLMPKYCDPSSFQLCRKKKRKGPLHLTLVVSCDEQTLPILDKKNKSFQVRQAIKNNHKCKVMAKFSICKNDVLQGISKKPTLLILVHNKTSHKYDSKPSQQLHKLPKFWEKLCNFVKPLFVYYNIRQQHPEMLMHLGRARLGLQICKQPKKDIKDLATNSRCKIT